MGGDLPLPAELHGSSLAQNDTLYLTTSKKIRADPRKSVAKKFAGLAMLKLRVLCLRLNS
jgi:hypothetical protein